MAYRYQRTPAEIAEAEASFLRAWNRDTDQSLGALASRNKIGNPRAREVVEQALRDGRTTRELVPMRGHTGQRRSA